MASIQLKPPESFDFKVPDDLSHWKRRFQQFREASGLSEDNEAKQINTLLYCMGEEAEDVLTSTNPTKEEKKQFQSIIAKFDSFFKIRKNVIFERARFNRRNQIEGESAEQYITQLYHLVENCEYPPEIKEELIRDRLVVGITDKAQSETLQLDAELTLEKAKKRIRQKEAIKDQQLLLKSDGVVENAVKLDELQTHRYNCKHQKKPSRQMERRPVIPASRPNLKRSAGQCNRCGREQHSRMGCPAKDAACHHCMKKGHYSSVCFSKRNLSEISIDSETQLDSAYLDTLTTNSQSTWMVDVKLEGTEHCFKMDTGAEVTAITEEAYSTIGKPKLEAPRKMLYGPSRQTLNVNGQFKGTLLYKGNSTIQTVYVVRNLKNNLLGLPTITSMKLVARMDSVNQDSKTKWKEKFPSVFSGLGTLGEAYEIKLKPEAKPFALFTARQVPLPLRPKVAQELERMESAGVISKVDQPTPWCAGMVVVPKKNGSIRICVDLKPFNTSVLCEVHPLPSVDDTLAQLSGAKVFSKLDANSGFWQVPLSRSSHLLTTFITPFGRYCFNKLPFEIASAPEVFQKRMNNLLQGLEGTLCLIDDILMFSRNQKEHEKRLNAVLQKLQETGVTLNEEKCEFFQSKVIFLGHLVDQEGIKADPAKTSAICQMSSPTNISELRRFLGMVNQLGKFSHKLAELSQPLRTLLSKKVVWQWTQNQEQAFEAIKRELLRSIFSPL